MTHESMMKITKSVIDAYIKGKVVEELEKINEKISMINGCGDFISTYDVQKLIETRILELKGGIHE